MASRVAARQGDAFGRLAHDAVTARHDVIRELATSPRFLSGLPDGALPSPLRAAVGWARDPSALAPDVRVPVL